MGISLARQNWRLGSVIVLDKAISLPSFWPKCRWIAGGVLSNIIIILFVVIIVVVIVVIS